MSRRELQNGAILDTARGLAMIGVIYIHTLEALSVSQVDAAWLPAFFAQGAFLASFLVPLFFLVSGAGMTRVEMKSPRSVLKASLQLVAFAYLAHFIAAPVRALVLLATDQPAAAGAFLKATAIDTLRGNFQIVPPLWFLVVLAVARLGLYLIARTARGGAFWLLTGAVVVLTFADHALPHAFNIRAWAPALAFMLLGYKLAPWASKIPWLMLPPAAVAVYLLAPLNGGCPLDATGFCPNLYGRFFVHFPTGDLGFMPLFYPTAILGCLGALALSGLIVRAGVQVFATVGRRTLQLLVVHGFIQGLVFPYLSALPAPPLNPPICAGLLVAEVALLMLLVRLFAGPLKAMLRASLDIAGKVTDEIAVPAARRLNLHLPLAR